MPHSDDTRLLGLMAIYNEVDILEENLRYHAEQGISFLILDNGSTDGSFELARSMPEDIVIAVRRRETESYQWPRLLKTLMEWSRHFPSSWNLLVDADTFLEPPWPDMTLQEAIHHVEQAGFNVVNFDNFEFWPVRDEPLAGSVKDGLRYYSWSDDKQEKCWRALPGIENHRTGGHVLDFPVDTPKRVFHENFVMRHYPVRSVEHGLRKVFKDRIPRFSGEPADWHIQYSDFTSKRDSFLRPADDLVKRIEGEPWCKELRLECRSAPRDRN